MNPENKVVQLPLAENKDVILNAKDIHQEVVEVPEWNMSVKIQTLTGTQRDEVESMMLEKSFSDPDDPTGNRRKMNPRGMRALVVSLSCINSKGGLLFSKADVEALERKSGSAINRIFVRCQKLSGLGDNAVENAAKN